MSDIAIRVDNLGKRYRVGDREPYNSLREVISRFLTVPFLPKNRKVSKDWDNGPSVWALKDVSFEIKRGEIVGLIGRNGAGKSTLLKILSRITEPTAGEAKIYGRVGSLLEVGTGFHRELTGRENIYLNGAILGMKKVEITRKFDEIVAFAEIDKFIDTPVKHYSSGMYMRLAFSVAAHLDPEILLVDEVLAVGDAAFQRKCLGKMGEIAGKGRTIMFVSHNIEAIQRLCERCLWFDTGRVALDAAAGVTASSYLRQSHLDVNTYYQAPQPSQKQPVDKAHLIETEVLDAEGKRCQHLKFGEPYSIRMLWKHSSRIDGVAYAVRIYDDRDRFLCAVNTLNSDLEIDQPGIHDVQCKVANNILVPGEYYISMGCYVRPHTNVHVVDSCLKFVILNVPYQAENSFNIVGSPVFVLQPSWSQKSND